MGMPVMAVVITQAICYGNQQLTAKLLTINLNVLPNIEHTLVGKLKNSTTQSDNNLVNRIGTSNFAYMPKAQHPLSYEIKANKY